MQKAIQTYRFDELWPVRIFGLNFHAKQPFSVPATKWFVVTLKTMLRIAESFDEVKTASCLQSNISAQIYKEND